MSFAREQDIQTVVEGAFRSVLQSVLGVEVSLPLERITWKQAMEDYGSDKPDRRFGLTLKNLSDWGKDCGFSVFENAVSAGGSVRGIRVPGGASRFSRKELDALGEFVKAFKAKGLAWMTLGEQGVKSPFLKFLSEEKLADLKAACRRKPATPSSLWPTKTPWCSKPWVSCVWRSLAAWI